MQTFLPYPNFVESASVLDDKRLGKQRSETKILLNGGWPNHPCSKMWRGYEYNLALYGFIICAEWRKRGFNDTLKEFFEAKLNILPKTEYPKWFGDIDFHASHRSNLLRKNFEFYSQFGWKESPDLPYVWPTNG